MVRISERLWRQECHWILQLSCRGLQISTSDDKLDQERENEQFKMLYKAEIDSYVKRKDTYHSNIGNAYALVYGQCSKAMQSKLQSRTDFEIKIKGNPIELLCGIQEHLISYQEHQYEMTIIADAMCNLVNLKQKEDESLIPIPKDHH